jgi:ABC-type sugar transport system ATPase subunit
VTTAAPAPIAIKGVGKRYVTPSGPIPAADGVSLTVRPREFVSLLGPSGFGKSTVLGMIGSVGNISPRRHRPPPSGLPSP